MKGDRLDRRSFLGLGVGALGVAAAPGWLRPEERLVRLTVPVMGTVAEMAVPARHEGMARQALQAAAAELRRVERLMTRFTATSDVGRFNAAAPGARVPVSPETAEVVREALAWARRSGGAFDPTLERLTAAWDPMTHHTPPSEELLRSAAADARGWASLELASAPGASEAWLVRSPGASLDLGGIAKGYGVDQAVRVLREHGIHRGLVNVGGDLMAMGDGPGGRPWRVGIRDPRSPEGLLDTVEVVEGAVATSGDYLRYFDHGGRRYHHILDPRTGAPAQSGMRTVTVLAADVTTADASATLAFTSGLEETGRILLSSSRRARIIHSG
ncbi:MAG TPA: FAD:protein FMN transferase [Longimicrobiales bacterium]|nr:FAD:protein FMN transferase [Longimicrobiales bacterium]